MLKEIIRIWKTGSKVTAILIMGRGYYREEKLT